MRKAIPVDRRPVWGTFSRRLIVLTAGLTLSLSSKVWAEEPTAVPPVEPGSADPAAPSADTAAPDTAAPDIAAANTAAPSAATGADATDSAPIAQPAPPGPESTPNAWSWAQVSPSAQSQTAGLDASEPESLESSGLAPNTDGSKLPWRDSVFEWGHSATTTLLGVGRDYQSASYQVYEQSYTLDLRYNLVDSPALIVHLQATPVLGVELTNSNATTTRNEPTFADTAVGAGVNVRVYNQPSTLLSSRLRGTLVAVAPTSRAAQAAGHYLTLSPRLAWAQRLPLRGPGSRLLNDLHVSLSARYDHLFSHATTAVDSDFDYTRQDRYGRSGESDILNGGRIAPNSLRFEARLALDEQILARPFEARLALRYSTGSLYGVQRTEIELPTEHAVPGGLPGARQSRRGTELALEFEYAVHNVLSIALGYENRTDLDAPSHNLLYTPNAVFNASAIVKLADLYEAVAGAPKAPTAASLATSHF